MGLAHVALALALSAAIGLPGTVTSGPFGPGASVAHGTGLLPSATDGVVANVTWDGVGVEQASSAASAFSIGAGQSARVQFTYAEATGTPSITTAWLVLLFAGVALTTETGNATTTALAGSANLSWSFGPAIYLIEGLYEIDAELLDANGTVLFHQPFYVDARAPYLVGSLLVLMIVTVLVVEAFAIRALARRRRTRRGRNRIR